MKTDIEELKAAVEIVKDRQKRYGELGECEPFRSAANKVIQAAQELIELRENNGWQPIETAPKDECVLVCDGNYVVEARFKSEEDGWWEINNDPTDAWGDQLYPTRWQPLPPRQKEIVDG
jgi:hypothetical protein